MPLLSRICGASVLHIGHSAADKLPALDVGLKHSHGEYATVKIRLEIIFSRQDITAGGILSPLEQISHLYTAVYLLDRGKNVKKLLHGEHIFTHAAVFVRVP